MTIFMVVIVIVFAIVGICIGAVISTNGMDTGDSYMEFIGKTIFIVSIMAIGLVLLAGLLLFIRMVWNS